MATFEVKTKMTVTIDGETIYPGLSVQISTNWPNPFDDGDKVHKAFLRLHGYDFKSAGIYNPAFFEYSKI